MSLESGSEQRVGQEQGQAEVPHVVLVVSSPSAPRDKRLSTWVDAVRGAGLPVRVHYLEERPADDTEESLPEGTSRGPTIPRGNLPQDHVKALVALGLPAAVAVAEAFEEGAEPLPLWLDLAGFEQDFDDGEPDDGDVYGFWHACAQALDLGDGYSVSTEAEGRLLHHHLGLRGRFRNQKEARDALLVLAEGTQEAPGALVAWLEEPQRLRRLFQLPGSGEQGLRTLLEQKVHELHQIHRSKMWCFWMWTMALRRPFSRGRGGHGGGFLAPRSLPFSLASVYRGFATLCTRSWVFLRGRSLELGAGLRRNARAEEIPASPPLEETVRLRRPRVLIVMPYSIYPPNHGGAVRLYNLIKQLASHCELYVLIFNQGGEDPVQREALEVFAEKVYFHDWKPSIEGPPWSVDPPNVRLFASHRVELLIRDLLARHRIEILQLEYTELAQYHRAAGEDVRVILVEHDISFRSFRRRLDLGFHQRFPDSRVYGSNTLDGLGLLMHEVQAARRVDQIHVMSADDGTFLSSYLPDGVERVRVVPNAVDTEFYRPPADLPERRGVLFVGNFQNLPNMDAFEFFVAEIWPRLRRLEPEAELSVVGAKMPESMYEWDGRDGIEIVGSVPDMRTAYHGHRVLACPIRAGSGTRLKLLEAFAAGIPAVSTALAAEGLDVEGDVHLLLAEEPEEFAAALSRMLSDGALRERLASAALDLAAELYDWSASAEKNLRGFGELLAAAPPRDQAPTSVAISPDEPASDEVEVSVIIPTLNGGEALGQTLAAIAGQRTHRSFEVICVDSGSSAEDLERMRSFGVRLQGIAKKDFNHGLTRDLGASLARGEFLVFLNQDAVPQGNSWLEDLLSPFDKAPLVAAVQGGMREFPRDSGVRRFFWDSCGARFYFTRESTRWIARYQGMGFSTVNAAIRRSVWEKIPFGWAPMMEDKKWQREVMEAEFQIARAESALVYHTHDYDLRSLGRRCRSEGYGWHLLGETYRVSDLLRDLVRPRLALELLCGILRGRVRKGSEVVFLWYRPWMLWVGNHWSRRVEH